ncbi:xanthine dehydrogenase family protein molybdopterin-binding subunit [Herbiconiux sp. P15]|uniref:xanthine dehydrogenase family protein molybdopterin-binding subunit n=1 Tax=Herbiconiux liukaitaii TaxID=3342799 RepID=UPI0035B7C6C1
MEPSTAPVPEDPRPGALAPGGRFVRPDGEVKARGEALFTGDLVLPGMLHARLLLAGRPHARIVRLDTSRARAMPGVHAVLTSADVPRNRYGLAIADRLLFAEHEVRYEGEIVAAVAATTLAQATAAVAAIEVEYEDLPAVVDAEAALADGAVLVHPDFDSYELFRPDTHDGNDCCRVTIEKGEADAELAAADIVVTSEFETDLSHPVSIEPHAVLAHWTGSQVSLWSTTQVPFLARAGVARTLGVPLSSVRVVVTHLGGGFGGKCDFHLEGHAAALSRAARRPVLLALTREEEFLVPDMNRHPIRITLTTGLSAEGVMVARRARLVLDTGAYASHGPNSAEIATLMAVGPYRIPHLDVEAKTVYTHRTPAGSTRSPTGPQLCWAVEQHTDEIAGRLGLDAVELRLRNLLRDGDVSASGHRVTGPSAAECLLDVRDRALEAVEPGQTVGLAVGWWGSVPLASGATVRVNPDASATLVMGAQDNGSGAAVALTAIVAEELGIEPGSIGLLGQDTDAGGFDWGSLGSQTTINAGRAVLAASREVAARLVALGAQLLGVEEDEAALDRGAVHVVGDPTRSVTLDEVMRHAHGTHELVSAHASPLPPDGAARVESTRSVGRTMYEQFPYPSYYAAAAIVEVDEETGGVHVVRLFQTHDIGRVLNPLGAEGQVHGGAVHSLGMALSEGSVLHGGMQERADLLDYRLQTALDTPPIDVTFLPAPTLPSGPYGTRSIGEAAVVPVAAAVGNAIALATGGRVRRLPMLPERVWREVIAR